MDDATAKESAEQVTAEVRAASGERAADESGYAAAAGEGGDFGDDLRGALGPDAVFPGEAMAAHTTFQVGGPAEWFVVPRAEEEVRAVVALCARRGVSLRVLGLGSNVLVDDAGVSGVVMQLADAFSDVQVLENVVEAQAGASNEKVARVAEEAGLTGYEFASGIPGTVGGAAIMNAGAYDGEFKDVATSVRCLTPEGRIVEVPADEAAWSYRHSMMTDRGYVVLGVSLRLERGDRAAIRERMAELAARRGEKQPLDMPSAGSTFKRPAGHYAGKLIQDAGLRGCRIGGAQVSDKHTGFVVNAGGATAADVHRLIAHVQERVFEEFGVRLQPEVRMWGGRPDGGR